MEVASLTQDRFYHDPRALVVTDIPECVHRHFTEKEEKEKSISVGDKTEE